MTRYRYDFGVAVRDAFDLVEDAEEIAAPDLADHGSTYPRRTSSRVTFGA